ncbi:MAG: T9SS type A sorting domain-containing protein [Bacteroidetes bacterium]|nr:T9SS type A sorting domain-containing protein [Bacteroidota bacterium]
MRINFCSIFLLKAICIFCFLATPYVSQGQVLDEVNFDSLGAWGVNTYCNDINDSGFVCGAYDSSGTTVGFVINYNGKICRFFGATGESIECMSINNKKTVLIKKTVGSTITVYKSYYTDWSETYGPMVAVGNVQQPGSQPFGINNINDITGYYPGGSSRWLFVVHDSITPAACTSWDAARYYVNPTYYNTYGYGINDNNVVTGYYIDGSNETPYIFNELTNTFTSLTPPAFVTHPYDINNSNQICGEYRQGNGTMMAFWAQVNAPNMTFHSMNTLFTAATIQSKASGINNKGEVAGSYLHPVTGKWVGFIYRPNSSEYRLPGYSFTKHAFKMDNTDLPANGVWTNAFYNSFDYRAIDPYFTAINSPILDSFNTATQTQLQPYTSNQLKMACVDWASFAAEVDTTAYLNNANPVMRARYRDVWRHFAFARWLSSSDYADLQFLGTCAGFSYMSLLRYAKDSVLHDWFNLPYNTDLSTYTQSSAAAITAINRCYLKQSDAWHNIYDVQNYGLVRAYEGMYRLKSTFLDQDPNRRNPRALALEMKEGPGKYGYHSVLPYKIHTPTKFPFDDGAGTKRYDTLFVYDSNYPLDTAHNYFLIDQTSVHVRHDSCKSYQYNNLTKVIYNETGVKQILGHKRSQLKSTSVGEDSIIRINIGGGAWYNGHDATGQVHYDTSSYTSTSTIFSPVQGIASNNDHPNYHVMDTSAGPVNIQSYQYPDSAMVWTQSNVHKIMGLNRRAVLGETDNTTFKNRLITYGTHDGNPKILAGYLEEMSQDYMNGVNILVNHLGVVQGDSLLTENPTQYVYKITKLTPGSTTYDLWVYSAGDDSVRQFINSGITLTGNTSHTIVPFFDGPNGTQVAVLVDQGLNGTYDDTLFVTYVPVDLQDAPHNVDYIQVYPNPAQKQLSVAVNQPQQAAYMISLLDVLGRIVYKQQMNFKAGNDVQQIPVSNLPQGAYFIRIADDKGKNIYMEKVLKQ